MLHKWHIHWWCTRTWRGVCAVRYDEEYVDGMICVQYTVFMPMFRVIVHWHEI